jgi:16S rRNA (guanine527-N7)-methyltransferase
MSDPEERLRAGIAAVGVSVDPGFEARARLYLAELGRWSEVSRLTGYRTEDARLEHLVLESLLFLRVLPDPAAPLLDVGTGAGAPGLILKLARPAWSVSLVEARRRPANFLRHIIRTLGLDEVHVHEARAEGLGRTPGLRAAFRTVTMRAVTEPAAAGPLARPFLEPGGHLVMPLGPRTAPSVSSASVQIVRAGAGLRLTRRFLIMRAEQLEANVPRGTRGGRGPDPVRGEPEGWRGQDHHRGESRRGPRSR